MQQGADQTNTRERLDVVELSLSSMVGLIVPYSMKIRGHVNNKAVIVLIDCRASHNFVSFSLIFEIGLPLPPTKEFGVTLGKGVQIRSLGCANNFAYIFLY